MKINMPEIDQMIDTALKGGTVVVVSPGQAGCDRIRNELSSRFRIDKYSEDNNLIGVQVYRDHIDFPSCGGVIRFIDIQKGHEPLRGLQRVHRSYFDDMNWFESLNLLPTVVQFKQEIEAIYEPLEPNMSKQDYEKLTSDNHSNSGSGLDGERDDSPDHARRESTEGSVET